MPGGTLVISNYQAGAVEVTRRVRDFSDVKLVICGSAEDADVRVHKVTPRGLTSEWSCSTASEPLPKVVVDNAFVDAKQ